MISLGTSLFSCFFLGHVLIEIVSSLFLKKPVIESIKVFLSSVRLRPYIIGIRPVSGDNHNDCNTVLSMGKVTMSIIHVIHIERSIIYHLFTFILSSKKLHLWFQIRKGTVSFFHVD